MYCSKVNFPQPGRLRLLLSCRDTGSVGHVQAILDEAVYYPWLEVIVYADGPAFKQLEQKYRFVGRFSLGATLAPSLEHSKRMVAEARRIIELEEPDAVLVGVSHCNEAGLDEAFLAAAFDRPKFAMQDFWGDVNLTLGSGADIYFALDEVAVQLTASRHEKMAIACGSPKHHRYSTLDVSALRFSSRSQLGIYSDRPIIGYFGQSLSHLPGYGYLLRTFARSVAEMDSDVCLIYRPHPRESESEIAKTLSCFSENGVQARLVTEGVTEEWLAAADVVVSCFSSCAYDTAFLNRFSSIPINSAIYLLFDESVAEYFRSVTGLEVPPPAELGLVTAVQSEQLLGDTLRDALTVKRTKETWRLAQLHLPDPKNATREILNEIRCTVHRAIATNHQFERVLP
jgi:hypothetical protein